MIHRRLRSLLVAIWAFGTVGLLAMSNELIVKDHLMAAGICGAIGVLSLIIFIVW
jgi:hypothetical protein